MAYMKDSTGRRLDSFAVADIVQFQDAVLSSFAGLDGYAYGNSWVAADAQNTPGMRYVQQVRDALGLAGLTNLAQSAFRMQDTAAVAVGNLTANTWGVGQNGIVMVGDLLNNLIEADTVQNRATALESMRALVALLSARERIEETLWTYSASPAWATQSSIHSYASGGSLSRATADGAYAEYTVRRPGTAYLLFHGTDGTTFVGGQAVIAKNGATIKTAELNNKARISPLAATNGVAPVVARLEGLRTGDVIRVTHSIAGRSGTVHTFFDALLPQWDTPPLVVLVKPVEVTISTHSGKPELFEYLRTVPDLVAAEFPNVIVIDPADGWNPATMLGSDQLHPNDLGETHIATKIIDGLSASAVRQLALAARSRYATSLPQPYPLEIASDSFNRADSSSLGLTPVGGVAYIETAGDWGIVSNRLALTTAASPTPSVLKIDIDETDFESPLEIEVTFSTRDTGTAILWRCTDADNWYGIINGGTSLRVYKKIAGTLTNLTPTSLASTVDGDRIKVRINPLAPDRFIVFRNDVQVGVVADSSIAPLPGRLFGICASTTAARFDDLVIREIVTPS